MGILKGIRSKDKRQKRETGRIDLGLSGGGGGGGRAYWFQCEKKRDNMIKRRS